MPFLPFRAKNPPERFPFVTLSLIAANCLIYLVTANLAPGLHDPDNPFLDIRHGVTTAYAVSWVTLFHEPWRLLTSIFLHADPGHVLGNMLFLWVFGPAVEGRLGHARFSLLYLLSGLFSGFFQTLIVSVLQPDGFGLGASGAIMGLMGAYLWMFPFATICIFVPRQRAIGLLLSSRIAGTGMSFADCVTWEWHAQWVVLYFFFLDLWSAWSTAGYSGVGHFAHMSGLFGGMGMAAFLKAKRDGRRASGARRMRADGVNLEALSAEELADMLRHEPNNDKLIIAYGKRVMDIGRADWELLFIDALKRYGPVLSDKVSAKELANAAIAVSPEKAKLPVAPLLRVGARLEKAGAKDDLRIAGQLFRNLFKQEKTGPDAETSLIRYAQVMERMVQEKLSDNPNEPIVLYQTLLRRFPQSPHVFAAQSALERLGAAPTTLGFSSGNAPASGPTAIPRSAGVAANDLRPL